MRAKARSRSATTTNRTRTGTIRILAPLLLVPLSVPPIPPQRSALWGNTRNGLQRFPKQALLHQPRLHQMLRLPRKRDHVALPILGPLQLALGRLLHELRPLYACHRGYYPYSPTPSCLSLALPYPCSHLSLTVACPLQLPIPTVTYPLKSDISM